MNEPLIFSIPIDFYLHFLAGTIPTIILLKLKKPTWLVFISVLVLAISKEIYDSTGLGSTPDEHIKDIIVTLIYPIVILGFRKLFFKKNAY